MNEPEFQTIKDLYEAVADENSGSYSVFRKKLHRLASGNVRTTNRIARRTNLVRPSGRKRERGPVRDFVAYDGEGENNKYVLLANSLGEQIIDRENGLSTEQCLEFLSRKHAQPTRRVFFSFGYDVNFIIKDFNDIQLDALLRNKIVRYKGYKVQWFQGKMFKVNGFTYYDVFSFFTTSFVNAIGQHLGTEYVTKELVEGKTARGTFETWSIEKIIAYNALELDLLVKLMEKLQSDFHHVGVYLQQWYGPGAVANYWFKEHGVVVEGKLTVSIIKALHHAYYGGRFEQLTIGKVRNPYEYDLHSAYPTVMADMPNFRSWKKANSKTILDEEYSIWYITFDLRYHAKQFAKRMYKNSPYPHNFMPLPVRTADGHLSFPMVGKGWYWYPEIKVMLDYFPDAKIIVHNGYIAETEGKPFAWVRDIYNERVRLKAEGNQAQFALKVGLNSLYGKTAQRIGRARYFSPAWAGYITAKTRAAIARAGYEVGTENVLGFATDAIFTTKPCKVPLSNELGDWEETQFAYGLFFQSGIYRMVGYDGEIHDRYRGSPMRKGIDDMMKQLKANPWKRPEVKLGRFVSNSLAMIAPKVYGPLRLQFVQIKHEVKLDSPVKRWYNFPHAQPIGVGFERKIRFGDILTQQIKSEPKVFSNDNIWFMSGEWLWGDSPMRDIESQPKPMTDDATMRLLAEAEQAATDAGFLSVESLRDLPVVEDPNDISED